MFTIKIRNTIYGGVTVTRHVLKNRYLWVLEGDTGKVLDGWPVKLPSQVRATVLLTKLVPGESSAADIVSNLCRITKIFPH